MAEKVKKLQLEGVRILWPNFSGKKTEFNAEGDRNFNILIEDPDLAEEIISAGWNLRRREGYEEEGGPPFWTMKVKVNYDSRYPPRIYKVLRDGSPPLPLDEKTVMMLDLLRIEFADVLLSPYVSFWPAQNKEGITAYLDTAYVLTEDNPLDEKWRVVE